MSRTTLNKLIANVSAFLPLFSICFVLKSLLPANILCKKAGYSPIINSAAVRCEDGGPAKLVAPSAAPPRAHATPPRATTAITARNGGPANHWPQHPLPERSDGDLKVEKTILERFSTKKLFIIYLSIFSTLSQFMNMCCTSRVHISENSLTMSVLVEPSLHLTHDVPLDRVQHYYARGWKTDRKRVKSKGE